jgi:hypothetical protein
MDFIATNPMSDQYLRRFARFSRAPHQRSIAPRTISGAHHKSRIHKSGIVASSPAGTLPLPIGTKILVEEFIEQQV